MPLRCTSLFLYRAASAVSSLWPNWIRRLTTNQKIGGSSPSRDSFLFFAIRALWCAARGSSMSLAAIAQLGERQTEDLKVPGSIPGGGIIFFFLLFKKKSACVCGCLLADSRHGILAEWLRRLIRNQLGTFPREFESLRCRTCSRGAMDSASDFESEGCGFESRRE